jgi:hypothetical protein
MRKQKSKEFTLYINDEARIQIQVSPVHIPNSFHKTFPQLLEEYRKKRAVLSKSRINCPRKSNEVKNVPVCLFILISIFSKQTNK